MSKFNPYEEYGCNDRTEYLLDLADEFGVDSDVVFTLADLLGSNEDFDGLVSELEDYTGLY